MAQCNFSVWVADRFGNPIRELNNFTSFSGEPLRIIDNVSDVTVEFGTECEDLLCELQPWAREIQLRTNGEIAWAGPITSASYVYGPSEAAPLTVRAFDLLQWTAVRVLRERIAEGPVSTQFIEIIELAMESDDVGLLPLAKFVGVEAALRITDVSDALNELVDLAPLIDFTMHGRELLVGAEEVPFATLPALMLPEMAVAFTLERLGDEEATQVWVRGGDDLEKIDGGSTADINGGRAVGSYPSITVPDPQVGVVQRRVYDTSILSDRTASIVAYSAYQYARPPLWAINVELNMDKTPFSFNDIVAGSAIVVNIPGLACFESPQSMRVKTVGVSIDSTEETVSLELIPAGVFEDELSAVVL